jgi:hypothetical protein
MPELGRLERVDPRTVWKEEARDFTPWLRENISLLSKTIGLDIDLVETEVRIGGFAADLVGEEPTTKKPVVIENQLSRTDHDHLGKLLTYASGIDAGTLVWVATDFRDEHKQTLEWLNNVSVEGIYFFGIQLEVIRVDESLPAPNFNIVVGPPAVKPPVLGQVTPRRQRYHDFFAGLLEQLKAAKPDITNASKVGYESWFAFSAGRSGFAFSFSFTQNKRFRLELYIDTGDGDKNKRAFDALFENRSEIQERLEPEVAWERLDTAQASRVAVYWPETVTIMSGEDRLASLRGWAVDTMIRFKQVLGPYITRLSF